MITRIISGGQTGADRGALLAAHDLGIKRGGQAPLGWRAEDGVIPEWFRFGMSQSPSSSYRPRTQNNVEHSDGTLILSLGPLLADSGSMLTAQLARRFGKPVLHLLVPLVGIGISRAMEWIDRNGIYEINVLNVAGPRERREPGIQDAVHAALVELLAGRCRPTA